MNSPTSLVARFYPLKCGHAPVGMYLGNVPKTGLTLRCRRMLAVQRRRQNGSPDVGASLPPLQPKERPAKDALEEVGIATGWSAGRCRHLQVSELLSMEKCDKGVMAFLIATDIGKFPPQHVEEEEE